MLHDFTKDKFDVFILAGQSNAEGYSFGDTEHPFEPSDKIWYLEENFTITQARELVVGNGIRSNLGLSFAEEYIRAGYLKDGRKLLILRASAGGTGFSDHRWNPEDDLFLRAGGMSLTSADRRSVSSGTDILKHTKCFYAKIRRLCISQSRLKIYYFTIE